MGRDIKDKSSIKSNICTKDLVTNPTHLYTYTFISLILHTRISHIPYTLIPHIPHTLIPHIPYTITTHMLKPKWLNL